MKLRWEPNTFYSYTWHVEVDDASWRTVEGPPWLTRFWNIVNQDKERPNQKFIGARLSRMRMEIKG